ncbi:MAG TPA: hypothetical protein VM901_04815 [Bdellovibrionota bacterium]|nr:hypothetical protein [Bdellovibrionota bacterium]
MATRSSLYGLFFLLMIQGALAQTPEKIDIPATVVEMLSMSDEGLALDLMRNPRTSTRWQLFDPYRPVYKQGEIFKYLSENGMESQFLEKIIRMSHVPPGAKGETGPAVATWEFFLECCSRRLFDPSSPYSQRMHEAWFGEVLANLPEDPSFYRINTLDEILRHGKTFPFSSKFADDLGSGLQKALTPSGSADARTIQRRSADIMIRILSTTKEQKLFMDHHGVQKAFLKGVPGELSFDKYSRPTNTYTAMLLGRSAENLRRSETMRQTLLEVAQTKPHMVAALLARPEFEHFRKNPELNAALLKNKKKFQAFELAEGMRHPALEIQKGAEVITKGCPALLAALEAQAKAAKAKN